MSTLSILHALPYFEPALQFGGPVTQTAAICRGLRDRGHRVRVVTTDNGVPPGLPRDEWVDRDGVEVWYATAGRLGAGPPYYARSAVTGLYDAMRDVQVLHLAVAFTHMNIAGSRLARRFGVPYVYAPRAGLCHERFKQKWLLKQVFLRTFERRIVRRAAAVHVLSEAEREQVRAQGADDARVVVIPNATPLAERTAWPEGASFRARHGIASNVPIAVFVGRLQTIKGLDLLVESFARAAVPESLLVLVGPDEGGAGVVDATARRLGIAERVRRVGQHSREELIHALRAADVFVLTSYSEGLSNAALEACAAGRPLVLTDRCNMPEVAESGAGFVAPPEVERLGIAMATLLRDRALRERMGAAARRLAEEFYALPRLLDRLEYLYYQLARGGSAAAGATLSGAAWGVRGRA